MRRRALMQSVAVTILLVVLASAPGLAALRDGYLGDVAVIAWLEGNVVKVALANESTTQKRHYRLGRLGSELEALFPGPYRGFARPYSAY